MFLTVHTAAGVIIGETVGNPWLGFLAGLISHFILDAIPHGDNTLITNRPKFAKNTIDLLIKLLITDLCFLVLIFGALYLEGEILLTWPLIMAVAGTILPDFIQGIYFLNKTKKLEKYFAFHEKMHTVMNGLTVSFRTGMIIQFSVLMILLFIIYLI